MKELLTELQTLYQTSIYNDPMFLKFPIATLALSIGTFLMIATPWTLLAWLDPDWAKSYN